LAGSFRGISQESIFPPPGSFAPARSPPLDPGIVALALVSAIVLAATIVLIATTALHIAWSDSCRWLNSAPVSPADQFAAGFALIHTGYSGFLIICYLAAFDEREIHAAAEWFRYQAHTGGAGLLVALMLAMERWRVVFGPAVWWRPPESLSILIVHGRSMMAFQEHAPARLLRRARPRLR